MSNNIVNLIEAEKKARATTVKNHPEAFELVGMMMKLYINGFRIIGNTSNELNDTNRVWLALVTRSFHSLVCSVELMQKGYYAQAMTLIRMVIEAYFLCGNCEKNITIIDALLYNKPHRRFNYSELATNMGASDWYDNDYTFACQFSHMSRITLNVMTTQSNPSYRDLKLAPSYDKLSLIICSKLLLRNGLLMTKFLGKLLDGLSKDNVNEWHIKAGTAVQQAQEWLDGLKERYGSQ